MQIEGMKADLTCTCDITVSIVSDHDCMCRINALLFQ